MTPTELEELKLKQYIESHPNLIQKFLGSLKRGVKETFSQKKRDSSRINAQKAREARKAKAEQDLSSNSTLPSEPKKDE